MERLQEVKMDTTKNETSQDVHEISKSHSDKLTRQCQQAEQNMTMKSDVDNTITQLEQAAEIKRLSETGSKSQEDVLASKEH